MQKIFFKRTMRGLKHDLFRYCALLLLVILSMFIVVAVVGAAQSVIDTVNQSAKANHLEDGEFSMAAPLNRSDIKKLEQLGFTIEEKFSLDFPSLRVMKDRTSINLVEINSGRKPVKQNEIVLERLYATAHHLDVGDSITVGGQVFTICGTGTAADYESCLKNISDMSSDAHTFGTAFVTAKGYSLLQEQKSELQSESFSYSYLLKSSSSHSQLKEALSDISSKTLTDFLKAPDNPRIKAAVDDVQINIWVGLMAGIIILILITFVISVFIVHTIDAEGPMIGALYALGLSSRQLFLHYTLLPCLLCLAGGVTGTLLGYSPLGICLLSQDTYNYFSIPPIRTSYAPWLLAYGIFVPLAAALAVNAVVLGKRLKKQPLALMRREITKRQKAGLTLKAMTFKHAFFIRQLLRERQGIFALLAGMFISLMVLILGINCYALCKNIQDKTLQDIRYSYMYQLKAAPLSLPLHGTAAYMRTFTKDCLGYSLNIELIGLPKNQDYFPKTAQISEEEISISSAVAQKYGLKVNESISLWSEADEKNYTFKIREIVPYGAGLFCFMDIDNMRKCFNEEENAYNVIFSSQELSIDPSLIYAISTKAEARESGYIFMDNMRSMIAIMLIVSVLLFIIVMYQMLKVIVNRCTLSIALMKLLGYTRREIQKFYMDGCFIVVGIGALVFIPAAKAFMDMLYPYFIANVACEPDFSWNPAIYLIVYAGILLCYLLTRQILVKKLDQIPVSVILKNRE